MLSVLNVSNTDEPIAGSRFIFCKSNGANIPTGPAMMILLAIVFVVGFACSPRYGLLAVLRARYVPDFE